jgi:2-keto-4-pentenoate hydratase/2-oxohepta-3-ene-1,7-dioic acid hydratase in catechol pathway
MKLLSYRKDDVRSIGLLLGKKVLDLKHTINNNIGGTFLDLPKDSVTDMIDFLNFGDYTLSETQKLIKWISTLDKSGMTDIPIFDLSYIDFEAPIPNLRKNIVCLGLNYADHVAEGRETLEKEQQLPSYPIFFTKSPTSINSPFGNIVYSKFTKRLDYEAELAVVIGKDGKNIPKEKAFDYIVGYSVFNDISARDLQTRHGQWYKGKSLDTFAPMGPYIVTSDEIEDPMNLDLWLKVNGIIRQRSNTSNMIFDIPTIISVLSEGITLEVGDVIATGTPSGVGSAHKLGMLQIGDVVEAHISSIGTLQNRVVSDL